MIRHVRLDLVFGVGILDVVHNFSDDRFPRQTKAVEFGEAVNADEDRHVVTLEAGETDRGEEVEEVEREDVKRIRHVRTPK